MARKIRTTPLPKNRLGKMGEGHAKSAAKRAVVAGQEFDHRTTGKSI